MRVKELIEVLAELPANLEVTTESSSYGYDTLCDAQVVIAVKDNKYHYSSPSSNIGVRAIVVILKE